jgi:hypothetical protein
MRCRLCVGKGELFPKHGKPGSDRHATYMGVWCVYPTVECPVCLGFGNEADKINKQAGKRVRIHDDGKD